MAQLSQEQVIEYLSGLTVMQLVDLTKALETKWDVKAAPVAAAVAMPAGEAASSQQEEEKTEFTVVLKSFGDKKIQVIKAIREVTGLGLKDAKDLVENVPKEVKQGVSKAESEEIAKKLKEAGAEVEVQ